MASTPSQLGPVFAAPSQAAPTVAPAVWQVPPVPASPAVTQDSPAPQGTPAPQAAPSAAGVVQTSVSLVQVSVGPHDVVCAHDAPAEESAAQTPHALPGAMLQNVLAHCAEYSHAPPMATEPAAGRQGAGMFALLR